MKKFDWKSLLPYAVAIAAFVMIAVFYCFPLTQGKVLQAGDTDNWKGVSQEARQYLEETGETTWWTGSMFSGMPTYQITGNLPSAQVRSTMERIGRFGFVQDTEPIGLIFAYFFGFFLMLICFGVNPWLSIVGAVGLGMSSYFFLIIPAGHLTKAAAIGALAPMIGGMYAIWRKRYYLGAPLVTIYGIIGVTLHPQMTYYVCMLLGVLAIAEVYIHIRDRRFKDFGISLGVLLVCAAFIGGTKYSWWQMNQSYLAETMRGGHSELTQTQDATTTKPNSGLDIQYATDWSYGRGETMTLLIPNWEGGASGYNLGKNSELSKAMRHQGVAKRDAENFCKQVPTYHGEKPFTSGPVYAGAIICFLFVLALLIVPGPYKWALLVATIFSILLAWGKNLMGFTELFFQYFPMYNKFRAVESILVVAEITIPLLAFLGLQQIVEHKVEWKRLNLSLLIAGGITAGLCLFAALFASSFDMTSSFDEQWAAQVPAWLKDAIMDQRVAMVKADAWRSLLFVALGFALVWSYSYMTREGKNTSFKPQLALYLGLGVLVLADMIPVNMRFFSRDQFVSPRENNRFFEMQAWEEQILEDTTPNFRVLNLSTSTFNDARTSYRLNSIGGYHAAKLRRYQDLIDQHIIAEMNPLMQTIMQTNGFMVPDSAQGAAFPVLNMLNMRYAVVGLQNGRQMPVQNPYAMGNAWFVEKVEFVDTPDEECAALSRIDLHTTAVADKKFKDVLDVTKPEANVMMALDSQYIRLTEYTPNRLRYEFQAEHNKLVVFSEVYFPDGWHLYIDGEEHPLGRANYVLRAAVIPSGRHEVRMEFVPTALTLDKISMCCIVLALVLSLLALTSPLWLGLFAKK